MRRYEIVFCATLALVYYNTVSFAYENIPFKNGGSIRGRVEFTGAHIPTDPILTLTTETAYCGKSLPAKKYLIKNRKIENVVVYLVGIKAGKTIPEVPVVVTNLKCELLPHVAVGFNGKKLVMKSNDPVFHTFDVHASLNGKERYHFALHEKGSAVTKKLPNTGILEISDYAHPWEHAYVYIFDQPYATITGENGEFVINDIPPGTYTIEAWHEELGTRKITDVQVESAKTTSVKLEYGEK